MPNQAGGYKILTTKASAEKNIRKVSFVMFFCRKAEEVATPFSSLEWLISETARALAMIHLDAAAKNLRPHVVRQTIRIQDWLPNRINWTFRS